MRTSPVASEVVGVLSGPSFKSRYFMDQNRMKLWVTTKGGQGDMHVESLNILSKR